MIEQPIESLRQGAGLLWHQETIDPIFDGQEGNSTRNHRLLHCPCLDINAADAFLTRRQSEHIGGRQRRGFDGIERINSRNVHDAVVSQRQNLFFARVVVRSHEDKTRFRMMLPDQRRSGDERVEAFVGKLLAEEKNHPLADAELSPELLCVVFVCK